MAKWVFAEQNPAAVKRDPTEDRSFDEEQSGEGEYGGNDGLVREVVQNALDARAGADPVVVRFAIHEASEAPSNSRLLEYFSRLRDPLSARGIPYNGGSVPKLAPRFLVCEDFGTRGLEGDPLLARDPPNRDPTQSFHWFWRNIGRSGKRDEKLGRWGLGKTVFLAASQVRCMFGYTRRADQRRLLMGLSFLQMHEYENREYMAEGYWCAGQAGNGLTLPIEDTNELARFASEWRLTRTGEPGLSVVSPYIPNELMSERLAQAAVLHYFSAILRGDLVFEVSGPDFATKLDAKSIRTVCDELKWDGPKRFKRHVAPPLAFIDKCLKNPPAIVTKLLGETAVPSTLSDAIETAELTPLQNDFTEGQRTGIRIRLFLPTKTGPGKEGHADVFLQRGADEQSCEAYFVREGMTVSKLSSPAARRGVWAFVNVDRGPLASLLGDAEGPAHEDWDTKEKLPDRTWKTWKGRVKFVQRIVDELVHLLTPAKKEKDFDLLANFFSIEQAAGEQKRPKLGGDGESNGEIGSITPHPKWFHVAERAGGFTLSRNSQVPMPEKPALKLSLAYDISHGDPLRTWSEFDFEVADRGTLRRRGKNVDLNRIAGNILKVGITEDDFQFVLDGFDPNRDVFVRVDDISGNGDDGSES